MVAVFATTANNTQRALCCVKHLVREIGCRMSLGGGLNLGVGWVSVCFHMHSCAHTKYTLFAGAKYKLSGPGQRTNGFKCMLGRCALSASHRPDAGKINKWESFCVVMLRCKNQHQSVTSNDIRRLRCDDWDGRRVVFASLSLFASATKRNNALREGTLGHPATPNAKNGDQDGPSACNACCVRGGSGTNKHTRAHFGRNIFVAYKYIYNICVHMKGGSQLTRPPNAIFIQSEIVLGPHVSRTGTTPSNHNPQPPPHHTIQQHHHKCASCVCAPTTAG